MRISDWSSDVCSSDLYKAAVPGDIRIDSYEIDADTAALLEEVYLNGLGEFAYRNGLDLHGRIRFPGSEPSPSTKPALKPSPSWVGLGWDGFPPGLTFTHPHPGPPGPVQLARRHAGLPGLTGRAHDSIPEPITHTA